MRFLIIAIVCFWAATNLCAQDRDKENEFFRLRNKIKESRIIEIRKKYAQNPCSGKKRPVASYKFDHSGNLIQLSQYSDFVLEKTIDYTRNDRGEYDSKTYTFFDTKGTPSSVEPWVFEYDARGQRIKEIWEHANGHGRVNILSYDDKGRIVEQVADSTIKWIFNYDGAGKLIETQDWEIKDSVRLKVRTIYDYVNGLLNFEMSVIPGENRVVRHISYVYDHNRNVIEMQGHLWLQISGKPAREDHEFRKLFEYDTLGNVLTEQSFSFGNAEPWNCVFYEYVYESQ